MAEARIIDGKALAQGLRQRVAAEAARLKVDHGLVPGLAVVLVGDDPASQVYVRAKGRHAEEAGLGTVEHLLAAGTPEREILELIEALNADSTVSGILVQLPLPDGIDEEAVLAAVDPMKDVDGFHPVNVGRLWSGGRGLVPCTPFGCLTMLKSAVAN